MSKQYNVANIRTLLTEGFTDEELRRLCYDAPNFRPVYDELGQNTGKAKIVDRLIEYAERKLQLELLLDLAKSQNPSRYETHQPYFSDTEQKQARLFICYKRHAYPDQELANYLHQTLTTLGHNVFIDLTMRTGVAWMDQIDRQIKHSDFLIVLLSKESANSEMVRAEVGQAYEYRKAQGKPHVLPVRINYQDPLPYAIAFFLNPLQYVAWQGESDNQRVAQDILAAIDGQLPPQKPTPAESSPEPLTLSQVHSEADVEIWPPPPPEYDPRLLEELPVPGGAVNLRDKLYLEREADTQLKREIVKWGTTTTIRAPRQTGKTSLLMRGIHHARQAGAKVVFLDFQSFGGDQLASANIFLRQLAESICYELRLSATEVEKAWQGGLGAQHKLTYLLEDYFLPQFEEPLVLAMDEADHLLQTSFYQDFFSLVRSWHNRRARYDAWEKLNLVMVISTEPYLLIADVSQSPFNVGLNLELVDFSADQVQELNQRHGSPVTTPHFPQLMTLLNGHPYLTRKALYTLVSRRMTWPDLLRDAATDYGPFADHLRRHQWGLRNQPELQAALTQVIRTNRCADEMSLFRLLRAGLIKGSGETYTCRCDLYRQYFADKLA